MFKSFSDNKKRCDKAFTLIELLVVISIISLLVSILLPSLSKARDLARRAACASNIRSVGMGVQLYMENNNDMIPLYITSAGKPSTWNALMAEYVGGIYNQDGLSIFKCPSDDRVSSWPTSCPYLPTQAMNYYFVNYNATTCKWGLQSFNSILSPDRKIFISEAIAKGSTSPSRIINPNPTSFYYPAGSEITIMANLHGDSDSNNVLFADWHIELVNSDKTPDAGVEPGIWRPDYQ